MKFKHINAFLISNRLNKFQLSIKKGGQSVSLQQTKPKLLTVEEKEAILTKLSLNAQDIMALVGCSLSFAYKIMTFARQEFNGRAGLLTNNITARSLCQVMGTTLEEELKALYFAKNEKKKYEELQNREI